MKILDLFCGAGGAARGYQQACEKLGIPCEITGVDINPQPRYPFEFVQADAPEYLARHGGEYDFVHASPPCQAYTILKAKFKDDPTYLARHPALIADVRGALLALGKPYVIENVMGAVKELNAPIVLCGHTRCLRGLKMPDYKIWEWRQI